MRSRLPRAWASVSIKESVDELTSLDGVALAEGYMEFLSVLEISKTIWK